MTAKSYYKLTQMTYLRQNLHDQVKIFEKYAFSRSSIISLVNAKCLCKIHFGHKNFICSPIFETFAGPIRTNKDQYFDMKIIFLSSPIQKFLRKTIIRGKFIDFRDLHRRAAY